MELPDLVYRLHEVLKDNPVLFFFCVHLSVGRTISVITGTLLLGLSPAVLLPLAWIGDMMNIPFFVTVYNLISRGLRMSKRLGEWFDRTRESRQRNRFYARFAKMGPIGIVLLAALPFWGCGMWSSILLAWSMNMKPARGSAYLAVGSLLGAILIISLVFGAKEAVELL